jgi:7-keto-8-aminopelargonate synthetase-like enzyme
MSMYEPQMLGRRPRMDISRDGVTSKVVNLSSYNYLGLAMHPEVIEAATKALRDYGTGACGSPLLSGMTDLHKELEHKLAAFTGREDCILFNSGFAGGMGTLTGLLRKGDVAILDAKSHLCSIDGAKLSKARLVFFDHNDPASLDQVLKRPRASAGSSWSRACTRWTATSPTCRTCCPSPSATASACSSTRPTRSWSTAPTAAACVEHYGVESRVTLQFATFSKAFAGAGSFTVGPRKLLQYIRYYINAYGFSCALPPSVVAGVSKALDVATRDNSLRERCGPTPATSASRRSRIGLNLGESTSQVVPIIIGSDRKRLYELTRDLHAKGLFLAPVDYPSVPEDGLRFRVAITAAHTREDLDLALQILEDTVVRTPASQAHDDPRLHVPRAELPVPRNAGQAGAPAPARRRPCSRRPPTALGRDLRATTARTTRARSTATSTCRSACSSPTT